MLKILRKRSVELTLGRGLARTRFSNFARICLAMSSGPSAAACGTFEGRGAQMA